MKKLILLACLLICLPVFAQLAPDNVMQKIEAFAQEKFPDNQTAKKNAVNDALMAYIFINQYTRADVPAFRISRAKAQAQTEFDCDLVSQKNRFLELVDELVETSASSSSSSNITKLDQAAEDKQFKPDPNSVLNLKNDIFEKNINGAIVKMQDKYYGIFPLIGFLGADYSSLVTASNKKVSPKGIQFNLKRALVRVPLDEKNIIKGQSQTISNSDDIESGNYMVFAGTEPHGLELYPKLGRMTYVKDYKIGSSYKNEIFCYGTPVYIRNDGTCIGVIMPTVQQISFEKAENLKGYKGEDLFPLVPKLTDKSDKFEVIRIDNIKEEDWTNANLKELFDNYKELVNFSNENWMYIRYLKLFQERNPDYLTYSPIWNLRYKYFTSTKSKLSDSSLNSVQGQYIASLNNALKNSLKRIASDQEGAGLNTSEDDIFFDKAKQLQIKIRELILDKVQELSKNRKKISTLEEPAFLNSKNKTDEENRKFLELRSEGLIQYNVIK